MAIEDGIDIIRSIRAAYDANKVVKVAETLTADAQENYKVSDSFMSSLTGMNQSDEALLNSFYKLPDKDKATILQDAVLAHQKFNWYRGQRINTVRDLEMFDLKTWAIKVFTVAVVLFGFVTALLYIFTPGGLDVGLVRKLDNLKDIISLLIST